jgi:hypothetical protein
MIMTIVSNLFAAMTAGKRAQAVSPVPSARALERPFPTVTGRKGRRRHEVVVMGQALQPASGAQDDAWWGPRTHAHVALLAPERVD